MVVSADTHTALTELKQRLRALGITTLGSTIQHLLDHYGGQGDPVRGRGADQRVADGLDDDESKQRVPALLSYESLAGEERAVKYYTGLKRGAQQWLWREFRTVVSVVRRALFCGLSGLRVRIVALLCLNYALNPMYCYRWRTIWVHPLAPGAIPTRATGNSVWMTGSCCS